MPVIVPDFGCVKWKMVNLNYTNVPLDISLGKLNSKEVEKKNTIRFITHSGIYGHKYETPISQNFVFIIKFQSCINPYDMSKVF